MLWPRKIYAPFLQAFRSFDLLQERFTKRRVIAFLLDRVRTAEIFSGMKGKQRIITLTQPWIISLTQRVPWAESKSTILPRELPTDSRKASNALAAYAKELPEDGIHYIRPLNPNQATWDALILQKGKSNLAVFFLQMSYCKGHEINHKGLQFVREALSNFQPISHMSLSFTLVKINNL